MVLHVYGNEQGAVIIMLHPMGITGHKLYEMIGSRLKDDYCFLVPDLGNHGDEWGNYESAEVEAASLYYFLAEKGFPEIRLLYGASMGAVTALELLRYKDLRIHNVYLDGAPIARLSWPVRKAFGPALLWQQKVLAKGNYRDAKEFLDRWGREITEHMASSFDGFSKKTIRSISRECVRGVRPEISEELQQHMYLEWGSEELYARKSPKKAAKKWPLAHICVRRGYNHCEYMFKERDAYVAFLERILRSGSEEGWNIEESLRSFER